MAHTESHDERIEICTERGHGPDRPNAYVDVPVEERDDGWYADTTPLDGQGMRRYAHSGASIRDVTQLLRQEYDIRY